MLKVHKGAKDCQHEYVRDKNKNVGGLYQSLEEANKKKPEEDCYILDSSTDDLWLVVRGKDPTHFDCSNNDLKKWYRDVEFRGRINKDKL